MMKSRLDKVKKVIKDNFVDGGLFSTPNWTGDETCTIYKQDGVTVDVCPSYDYFEVFGLTDEEFQELDNYYNSLCKKRSRGRLHI